jgi:preprotein translocase subunit SecG
MAVRNERDVGKVAGTAVVMSRSFARSGRVHTRAGRLRAHAHATWGAESANAGVFAHACATPAPSMRRHATLLRVETLDSILQVALSVIVIFLVLMHSGKDSGLSGAFGVGSGTGPLGGGSMVERNLNRWTIFFAVLFFVNAIVLLKRPWG